MSAVHFLYGRIKNEVCQKTVVNSETYRCRITRIAFQVVNELCLSDTHIGHFLWANLGYESFFPCTKLFTYDLLVMFLLHVMSLKNLMLFT